MTRVVSPLSMIVLHFVSKEVFLFSFHSFDLPEELATRIVNNKVLSNRLIVPPSSPTH